jgi:hypothetical protein
MQAGTRPSDLAIPLDGPTSQHLGPSLRFYDEVGVGNASRHCRGHIWAWIHSRLEQSLVLRMT